MCANDLIVQGAEPLFFLDYYATGKLDNDVAATVVSSIAEGCRQAGCALIGGETAEMPGLYAPGHFDLAGTIVGTVDVAVLPDPSAVEPGDAIVALPAHGLHTNGYSLARAFIPREQWNATVPDDDRSFADALLAEHPSYYAPVRAIQRVARVKAMAHITGGGLRENIPRTLPHGVKAIFEQQRWPVPPIERELVRRAGLDVEQRYRVLNMGVGYTLIVPLEDAPAAVAAVSEAFVAGWIEARDGDEAQVVVHPARDAA